MQDETQAVDTATTDNTAGLSKQANPETDKYRTDMLKYKDQLGEERRKAEELSQQLETMKNSQMEQEQDLEKKASYYRDKYEELLGENKNIRQTVASDKKFNAIEKFALEKGIRKEALEDLRMLDSDDVVIETTSTGRVNVLGASEFVDTIKESRPHWFKADESFTINNNSSQYKANETKTFSPTELLKLQKENPKKYKQVMHERIKNKG